MWFGNDDNTPMNKVTGGSLPAQTWRQFMLAATPAMPVRPLPSAPPPGIGPDRRRAGPRLFRQPHRAVSSTGTAGPGIRGRAVPSVKRCGSKVTLRAAASDAAMSETAGSLVGQPRRGSAGEVFLVALRLGLTSFGGPIAHLGYYERTYVRQRQWLSPDEYAGLVALCQMVPGPASSQVGYLIGLRRAGWGGAFAAWAGFTLPSAIVMFAFALLAPRLEGRPPTRCCTA